MLPEEYPLISLSYPPLSPSPLSLSIYIYIYIYIYIFMCVYISFSFLLLSFRLSRLLSLLDSAFPASLLHPARPSFRSASLLAQFLCYRRALALALAFDDLLLLLSRRIRASRFFSPSVADDRAGYRFDWRPNLGPSWLLYFLFVIKLTANWNEIK